MLKGWGDDVPEEKTITRIFVILDDIREKLAGVLTKMNENEKTNARNERLLDDHGQRIGNLENWRASLAGQQGEQTQTSKVGRDWALIIVTAIAAIASVVAVMK